MPQFKTTFFKPVILCILICGLFIATFHRQSTWTPESPRTKLTSTRSILLENFTLVELPKLVVAILFTIAAPAVYAAVFGKTFVPKFFYSIRSSLDPPDFSS